MKILITGINGFVGSHMAEFLLKMENVEVSGVIYNSDDTYNITHIRNKLELFETDVQNFSEVKDVIAKVLPDKIYHFAAQSLVHKSFSAPNETMSVNINGQLNVFEAVRALNINPFIQVVGSSDEYGLVNKDETPITEDNPLRPLSPYAVSKVAQDLLGYQYFKSYGLNIIRTRSFNHTGIRRPDNFVLSSFAKQIALIEKDKQEPVIYTGNIDVVRDFSDIKDIINAYWLCLEKGKPGEVYNICSGKAIAVKDALNMLLSLTNKKIETKQDPKRLRESDAPIITGDSTKFQKQTGWKPQIPLENTLGDLLNWWREKV